MIIMGTEEIVRQVPQYAIELSSLVVVLNKDFAYLHKNKYGGTGKVTLEEIVELLNISFDDMEFDLGVEDDTVDIAPSS